MSTIAITGSASGMGAATRALLSDAGHRVIGVDLHDADIVADLGTASGRAAAIEGIAAACGGQLDGAATFAGVIGMPGRDGAPVASVNYFGTVEVMTGIRGLLASSSSPAAVCISSNSTTCQPGLPVDLIEACLAGDEPSARDIGTRVGAVAAYGASKMAISRWVRRQATTADWIGAGVTLNAVAPGYVTTPMTEEGMRDPEMAPMLKGFPVPVGRPGRPEEIASIVAFLLGADARFFCGSVLFCDGGSDALFRANDFPTIWNLSSH